MVLGLEIAVATVLGFFHRAPTSGANWRLFERSPAERGGVTSDQAIVRCLELGDGWQVPAPANLPALNPMLRSVGVYLLLLMTRSRCELDPVARMVAEVEPLLNASDCGGSATNSRTSERRRSLAGGLAG